MARHVTHEASDDPEVRMSAMKMAQGAWNNRQTSDPWVERLAPQWPPRRQPGVDRNIIRLAIYELTSTDTPAKVVIDYDNLDAFREYVGAGFQPEYLVLITNQLGPRSVSVLAYGREEGKTYPTDDELLRLTVFGKGRDRELAALTAQATRDAVRRQRIRLTSFAWLVRRGSPPEDAYT